MTVITETRERLLRAIVKEVPVEQIAEIHFFQPIKQGGVESGVAVVAASPVDTDRYTVYTALYRLTLKGPERGKWEASVVPEAEAPLDTVDTVVRGVQRRSGDVEDPERFSGDALRALL